ncbi:hypothetical protein LUW77_00650 [Streptomyces radiopugnans]|nr:hypothetical protein LUW77_00650 [Streptomyces radiopugnans]
MATAARLRQMVCPGTADLQTARNACKDLAVAVLAESVGKATRMGKSGERLWNLTPAGLGTVVVLGWSVRRWAAPPGRGIRSRLPSSQPRRAPRSR